MINGTRAVFSCSVILAQFPCSPSCHGNSKFGAEPWNQRAARRGGKDWARPA